MTKAFTSLWMTLLVFMAVLITANGWDGKFKEVTLQDLDANNNIVNTQVAVPTEVVVGKDNTATQDTSQSATNSITNANVAGRRLLGDQTGKDWAAALGAEWKQVTLQYLDTNNQLVNIQVAVPTQVIIGNNNTASQSTSQTSTSTIVNENSAGRRLLGGFAFSKFTLQYLDANNNIQTTQVAVPTQAITGSTIQALQSTSQITSSSISNANIVNP